MEPNDRGLSSLKGGHPWRGYLYTFFKPFSSLELLVGGRTIRDSIVSTLGVRISPSSRELLHQSRTGNLHGSGLGVAGRLWRGMQSQKSPYRPKTMSIVSLISLENSLYYF